ncbi:two-component system histidine kinase PnpS [Alteribacter natronophilus]|uniref:two-component system histidine kinase PnpS n=1 Tax=Alteribacter natronophilus TaxID=2583810 RepID=UPI00110F6582|nr:ATP-binding protein [Alteribacter natronophilus]TMW71694.1 PAS domain-containing protein [Alteribacter natronophilus]
MTSYRSRFIFPLAVIVFVVLASLGALLGPLFKEFYFERMGDRIEKEAGIVAYNVEQTGFEDEQELQTLIETMAEELDLRVTLLSADQQVVAESVDEEGQDLDYSGRPEIQQAVQEGEGKEIRMSRTLNEELLYYVTVLEAEGQTIGYLRLGLELGELNRVYRSIWIIMFVSFSLAFLIIFFLTTKLTNQMIAPIEEATRVAKQLAQGNFKARTYEGEENETGNLNRSLNVLAQNLSQVTRTYQMQQEHLETLIENMGSGLLLINSKGDITLVNRSCKEIFQEDTDEWLHKLYYRAIKHRKIIKLVQEIFLTEKGRKRHLELPIGIEMRHFDVYAAPIIGSNDKLRGIVLVFHDITDLKKLEQARKDFVANVSHELKTPVTSLKGFTETLLAGAMESPEYREKFLTIIAKESDRLESLISDLLELSKIEGSHFQLDWQQLNLHTLADEVKLMLQDKADKKKITLETKVSGNPEIDGDPHRIKQIIINLVNNAISYTPEEGAVTIRIKEQVETVLLEVEDTGIGISRKELPRLFERFYRVDPARSRNSGGTGLGLAIVKHLAEAHRAKLDVTSEVNKGTKFKLAFFKRRQEDKKKE